MDPETSKILFSTLVTMLSSQAMITMGKLKNPVTDRVEQDLQTSRTLIDMIAMLRERTKGNLSDEEQKMIDRIVSDLQMNFIVEIQKNTNPASPDATQSEPKGLDEEGIPDNVA